MEKSIFLVFEYVAARIVCKSHYCWYISCMYIHHVRTAMTVFFISLTLSIYRRIKLNQLLLFKTNKNIQYIFNRIYIDIVLCAFWSLCVYTIRPLFLRSFQFSSIHCTNCTKYQYLIEFIRFFPICNMFYRWFRVVKHVFT